jgi:hypothetical protein
MGDLAQVHPNPAAGAAKVLSRSRHIEEALTQADSSSIDF